MAWLLQLLAYAALVATADTHWWSPLPDLGAHMVRADLGTLVSRVADPGEGECPAQPQADTAWALVADGACRKTVDEKLKIYIIYALTCQTNGSVVRTFVQVLGADPGTPNCNQSQPTMDIPEGYCFAGIPGTTGTQIVCDSDTGNAQLLGWTGTVQPKFNQSDDKVIMKDGAKLTTQTVFPTFLSFPPNGRDKSATLYVQTPYDINGGFSSALKSAAALIDSVVYSVTKLHFQCVVTLQQNRGLYTSGPPTEPDPPSSFDCGNHTKSDSGDSGVWIKAQNWSNGVVMTQGASAMGMMASLAAGSQPHLVTRASWLFITTNNVKDAFVRQGVLQLGILGAILHDGYLPPSQVARGPLAAHDSDCDRDPFWQPMKFDDWSQVSWPSVHRTSWFDMFQKGGLRLAERYYNDAKCAKVFGCTSTLLVDALGHAGLYSIPNCTGCFPYNKTAQGLVTGYETALSAVMLFTYQNAVNDVIAAGLNVFYSALMKFIPDKIVFVLGSAGNYVTAFNAWPTPVYEYTYLSANQRLTNAAPTSGNISYVYDPADPAPTFGGWYFQYTNPNGEGSVDQSPLATRKDVVHFDGLPLAADTALCGAINASLVVASSANDTDFIVRLVDQYPTGERYLVAEGVIRMRWRSKTLEPVPIETGSVYTAEIDMWNVCWIFAAGHQIGIDVTSSSEFMYLPNPNTGLALEPNGIWPQGNESYKGKNVTATNSVLFGASRIALPVVLVSQLPVINPLRIPTPTAPPSTSELIQMGEDAMRNNDRYMQLQKQAAK